MAHGHRDVARALGVARIVIIGAFAISAMFCCFNKDATLVVLDRVETHMICKYRAEKEMIRAQQEFQKLQTGKDNDDVK